ncbi:unnamed protein product [Paramecium primaurelia]|uniref:Uncharacterized protein n=1 Tax=Paramecium primaurelia TaxID=5886 RepID=A0A8S1NER0_PARPR|nr:unnamed protein product [Paramecium primaurelia]
MIVIIILSWIQLLTTEQLRTQRRKSCIKIKQFQVYNQNQIAANTQQRDETIKALAVSEEDIRVTIQDIANNEATYVGEEATRNQQHETFVFKVAAIDAIDDAAKLIQHLSLGASFAQIKTKFDTLHKKLSDNTSHFALSQPVIAALTELATHGVNQKALKKIAQLLSEIRQQLVQEKAAKTDIEERQAAHWAEQDWLKERPNWKYKFKNKKIPLKMLFHGLNFIHQNWKIVMKDLLDNKHGFLFNHKYMKLKQLKELLNKKLLTDSKNTLVKNCLPLLNLLQAEIDFISLYQYS